MNLLLTRHSVVVWDLDDTLYPERDFVRSGFAAVSRTVEQAYGVSVAGYLWERYVAGRPDALGDLCRDFGLPPAAKADLLQVYRYHRPDIRLNDGALALLDGLAALGVPLGLITDGRSLTQRHKLAALGLQGRFGCLCISSEIGAEKPDPCAFRRVMAELPARHYVYIADNPRKDFIAPNALGWQTLGVRNAGRGVHDQTTSPADAQPQIWVDGLNSIHLSWSPDD